MQAPSSASILFGLSDADFEDRVGPIPDDAAIAASVSRGLGRAPGLREVLAHRDAIVALAAHNGFSGVRLMGSVARGTETGGSDLDLLVTPTATSGADQFTLACDLEQLLDCRVDVILESEVPPGALEKLLAGAIDLRS